MIDVVSFSGGRTSAYLVKLRIELYISLGILTKYIFMDTGAEHPETYAFIRRLVAEWGIDLICLRLKVNPILGQANSYEVISIDEIGKDLQPWIDMLKKYGTPYNPGGAFCTDRMKLVPYTKYCDEHFGKKNYTTWLGMRDDEPTRIKPKEGFDYLATLSDFDKDDVLEWWSEQPFDLNLPEHLGNCVFCIKKGVTKVALAAKDEPLMYDQFAQILESPDTRVVEQRKSPSLEMYRGRTSLRQVVANHADIDRDELFNSLRSSKRLGAGCGSQSCEIFSEDGLKYLD